MKKNILITTAFFAICTSQVWAENVYINAGGSANGSFVADKGFGGGWSTTSINSNVFSTSGVTNPAPQAVYQQQRYGSNFTYVIPGLINGAAYTVRLDMAEPYWTSTGQRIFNVSINGLQVLANYDLFADAGGALNAVAKSFSATADASGQIVITFTGVKDYATVAGIEILSGDVYINAGGVASGSFVADKDFGGAWSTTSTNSNSFDTSGVTNPAPQAVYQQQRYGSNFSYTVPGLNKGSAYTVRLDMAEPYWTSTGQRIFNVSINGVQVLANYDLYADAGGESKAVTKSFNATADASGQIVIAFTGVKDYATVAGIEIIAGTVSGGGDVMPWVYDELWSAASPFRATVAAQKSAGVFTTVPHTYMDSLWNQGIAGNGTAAATPIYVAKSTDPLKTVACTQFGGNCNAKNVQIHVPSYAVGQAASDGHEVIIDENAPGGRIEIDCWQAQLSGGTLNCSWAGKYILGVAGTDQGGEGIHGGMAISTVFITGQELVNGVIHHTLGLNTNCLNDPMLYPANTANKSDQTCSGGGTNPPHYGNLIHLLWSSSQIANSAYSAPCKTILTALATYGAYTTDTGNNGLELDVVSDYSYTKNPATASQNPWPNIQNQLNSHGDGNGNNWSSCFNRLKSSDFELLQLKQP